MWAMDTPDDQVGNLLAEMRRWKRQSQTVAAQRDPLVRRALEAGFLIEEVHAAMGIGRSTISRIVAPEEPCI